MCCCFRGLKLNVVDEVDSSKFRLRMNFEIVCSEFPCPTSEKLANHSRSGTIDNDISLRHTRT